MCKKFDIIYSIGSNCGCANLLNDMGRRISSGPFDWVVGSDFEKRIELIMNNFDDMLIKENLVKYEIKEIRHDDIYFDTKTGLKHPHDFDKNKTFDEAYVIAQQKYQRRIKRFLDCLNNKDKKVALVYIAFEKLDIDYVKRCSEKIINKFGNHIHFIVLSHNDEFKKDEFEKSEFENLSFITSYNTVYKDGEQDWRVNPCLTKPLRDYKLILPYSVVLKRIALKLYVKIIVPLIPSKKKRREIRKKINNKV